MDDGQREKKISWIEGFMMVFVVAFAWALGLVATLMMLVPVIGPILLFLSEGVDFFVLALIQFWLILKGGIGFSKQMIVFAGNLAEMVPLLNMLPLNLLTLGVGIWLINRMPDEESREDGAELSTAPAETG